MTEPVHVQTKREIRELLSTAGIEPRKRFGQHFLIDGNLMRRLISCAELESTDMILEVGGGTGGLTDLLIERVEGVVCVEVDRDLHALLTQRYTGVSTLTLIHGDILKGKHHLQPEVTKWLDQARDDRSPTVKLVANLPYQIATPLVMNLLVDHPRVRRLCFTVQAELAERITAPAGCSAYGPVSIVAQSLCRIETVTRVPRRAFWPEPGVDSKILRLDVTESPFASRGEVRRFAKLLRGLFDHRRKTLRSSLKYVANRGVQESVAAHFDVRRRPESLEIEEWLALNELVVGSKTGISNLKKAN